jgi:hypothetical protein
MQALLYPCHVLAPSPSLYALRERNVCEKSGKEMNYDDKGSQSVGQETGHDYTRCSLTHFPPTASTCFSRRSSV